MKTTTTNSVTLFFRRVASIILLILAATASVSAQTPKCAVSIQHYASPGSPDSIHFYVNIPTGTTAQINWNFGDGSNTSQESFPWHLYAEPGKYKVCVSVTITGTNGIACSADTCDSIYVNVQLPPVCRAVFSYYPSPSNPDSIHFYAYLPTGTTAQYTWNFGDGSNPSHDANPWHSYANAGKYKACLSLTVAFPNGATCTADTCDSVFVNRQPPPFCSALFQHYSLTHNPDSVHFYPTSTNATNVTYSWNFGDGSTSTDPYPWHLYAKDSIYYACLTVTATNSNGGTCTDTKCDSVHIARTPPPMCNAKFVHYPLNSNPDSVHFYVTPTNATNAKYYWSFGDNSSPSTEPSPWHLYANNGRYRVCLVVTDSTSGGKCTAEACDSVNVPGIPAPVCNAHFQDYPSTHNPDSIHFYSVSPTATTTKYIWDFGDGQGGHTSDPWHLYANAGKYNVCLTVTDSTAGGKCTSTLCDSVLIIPPPTCNAAFKIYRTGALANTVYFAGGQNPPGTHYSWNFGDQSPLDTGQNVVHTYTRDGGYRVCLTVTNTRISCSETSCDSVHINTVPPPSCNARFVHYANQHNPDSLHFYVTPSNLSTTRYKWLFGDSDSSHLADPWHLYANAGKYRVCLIVTDTTSSGSCINYFCDSILVTGPPAPVCNARFYHYSLQHNPDSVHFYSNTAAATTTKYDWSFGDGTADSQERYPWHLYAAPGGYKVCLTVTDSTSGGKCTDTWCDSIHILPPPPPCHAAFTHVALNSTNTEIHFIPAPNPLHSTYSWNFGDQSTLSPDSSPTHTYANYGTYYVCLTVTSTSLSGDVCTETRCDSVHVGIKPASCDAHFTFRYSSNPFGVYFVSAPNAPGTNYTWDFGDGSPASHDQNVLHQFGAGGIYNVCLTVTNTATNCQAQWCFRVPVGGFNPPVCNSNFYFVPGSAPHSAYFIGSPNSPSTKYLWDFGDDSTDTHQITFHQFAGTGSHVVCLTVTDTVAICSDKRCITIGPLRMANGGSTLEGDNGPVSSVYPNPASESAILHIENTNGAATFRLYDNIGSLVKVMTNLTNGDFEIDVHGLKAGLYIYEVSDSNNATRGKLIIQ